LQKISRRSWKVSILYRHERLVHPLSLFRNLVSNCTICFPFVSIFYFSPTTRDLFWKLLRFGLSTLVSRPLSSLLKFGHPGRFFKTFFLRPSRFFAPPFRTMPCFLFFRTSSGVLNPIPVNLLLTPFFSGPKPHFQRFGCSCLSLSVSRLSVAVDLQGHACLFAFCPLPRVKHTFILPFSLLSHPHGQAHVAFVSAPPPTFGLSPFFDFLVFFSPQTISPRQTRIPFVKRDSPVDPPFASFFHFLHFFFFGAFFLFFSPGAGVAPVVLMDFHHRHL